jgi:exosortase K
VCTMIKWFRFEVTRQWSSTLLTLAVIVALLPLSFRLAGFRQMFFCFPAAQLSALFLSAPCVRVAEGYLIEVGDLPILVSLACSGSGFFVLLLAMMLGLVCRHNKLSVTSVSLVAIAAYGVMLVANVCRITLGFFVAVLSRHILPECLWAGIHLCVGVLVFLCALVLVYLYMEWRLNHE